jgi:hypothetical protein
MQFLLPISNSIFVADVRFDSDTVFAVDFWIDSNWV